MVTSLKLGNWHGPEFLGDIGLQISHAYVKKIPNSRRVNHLSNENLTRFSLSQDKRGL